MPIKIYLKFVFLWVRWPFVHVLGMNISKHPAYYSGVWSNIKAWWDLRGFLLGEI